MAVPPQPKIGAAPAFPGVRILVVDNEQTIRRTLTVLFERLGCKVAEAGSGEEVLALIARQLFDLVFLDIDLPETDSAHLLQAALRIAPDTVFIILTPYSKLDTAIVAVRHGAFRYLFKPSPEHEILQAVETGLIERRRLLRRKVPVVPPELALTGVQAKAGQPRKLPSTAPVLELADVSADSLWSLSNYLTRAVAAFESRMYGRAARSASPPLQPYKSLYPFEIEDRGIFFGRSAPADSLYQKVLADRLTVLHGKSGVGKTSLLNAGLSPLLIREGRLPVYVRIDQDPVHAIKHAIAPPSLEPWPDLLDRLALHQFLDLTCDRLSSQTRELVLVLDHFEEFLIYWPEREHRRAFVEALAACYNNASLPIRIIVSLRGEYFSDLAQLQGPIPTILKNELWLDTLAREDALAAITGPAAKMERPVDYEPALLEALLGDLSFGGPMLSDVLALEDVSHSAAEGVEPPQLQLVCTRLYETLATGDETITLAAYEKLGRAEGILRGFLQATLDHLPRAQVSTAKAVLKELVSSRGTRRLLRESALAARVEAGEGELETVLTGLVEDRILRHTEVAGHSVYELAHGYLIKELRGWIDPGELALKRVQELLERELLNWRQRRTLLPQSRLQLLHAHREQLKGLDDEARAYLLRSSLKTGFAVEDWAKLAGQAGESPLLDALEDRRDGVRRAIIRSLGAIWGLPEVRSLTDENGEVRQVAAEALGEMGDARAVKPLIAVLQDEDAEVRWTAARALGRLGDNRAFGPLVTLLEDGDRDVRLATVAALGELRDDRAVSFLSNALLDGDHQVRRAVIRALGAIWNFEELINLGNEDRYVGWAAARKLGELGDPRAVEALITVLRDEHREVRRSAAAALVELGQPAVQPLIAALEDADWDVRQTAAEALGEIGDLRALEPLNLALRDAHSDVRRTAARALVKLGEPALETLITALRDTNSNLRALSAEALGRLGDPRAVRPLTNALRDYNSEVRQMATQALVRLGQPAVVPLILALEDEDHLVRRAAANVLGAIGDPRAVDRLIDALRDKDPDVRRAIANALDEIGDPRALEPFIAALEDDDRIVRREAAWALGQLGNPSAVEPLIAALQDEDRGVRQAASGALVKMGQPVIETLCAALGDANAAVRWAITGVLGQLGDSSTIDPLIALLQDRDHVVRRAAATSLGKVGDARAVEPLIAALSDSENGVRWAAALALSDLADPRAVEPLIATLGDKDSSVQRAAAEALQKIGTPEALDALSSS